MWWSVKITASLFHRDLHARSPMLNCVPDSWPSFFRITMLAIDKAAAAPLSGRIALIFFYRGIEKLYIGP